MLAWIFHVDGRKPNFLVGGVAEGGLMRVERGHVYAADRPVVDHGHVAVGDVERRDDHDAVVSGIRDAVGDREVDAGYRRLRDWLACLANLLVSR